MNARRLRTAAAVAATVVLPLSAPAAHAATGHRRVVSPGQSIQAAVDAASPGDEIIVEPGVYAGSVRVTTPRITLRGAGPETVVVPGTGTENACATAGHGICVTGTDAANTSGVTVENLTVHGFRKNGLDASAADDLTVTGVTADSNGEQGISQERSVRGRFSHDIATGNGQAGIFLANTVSTEAGALDTQGTRVTGNQLSGNRFGVVLRRLRNLTVEGNEVTGNCGGVFVIGDENTPRGGDLDITGNDISANNAYCAATGHLPFVQGTGVLLTGTEDVRVTGNLVADNTGTSPMSGGIVLYGSIVGVHNTGAAITGNTATGNAPADFAQRDTRATGTTFAANTCGTTVPEQPGRCTR